MYSLEELSCYPFFREALMSAPLTALHDSLTGLIVRPVILRFVQSLIQARTPFTLAIVDLDNFKSINDNYGHRTGDEMLSAIAEDLRRAVGPAGLVGRYGGDEFLLVLLELNDYDLTHSFFEKIYGEGGVFRKNLLIRERSIFSTATVGSASCPKNADNFEALFALADKALYRGKSKGRNCFIIYVPEKHDRLEIPKLGRRSLYDCFRAMADGFDRGRDMFERLQLAFLPMIEDLRMHRLFFVDAQGRFYDVQSGAELERVVLPEGLLRDGFYTACGLEDFEPFCPAMSARLDTLGFESVLLSLVTLPEGNYGALVVCPEIHTLHIWQDNECAAAFFLSRMLTQQLAAEQARG